MQATQLELTLWDNLQQTSATPEAADLLHLCQELEAAIGPLPQEHRLQTAGKVIAQIVEVFALRCDLILSAWEEAHNDQGPAVDEDAIAGLVRQTMSLDLSELMEVPAAEQRQTLSASVVSVAGLVDKAALLEAFGSEIELVGPKQKLSQRLWLWLMMKMGLRGQRRWRSLSKGESLSGWNRIIRAKRYRWCSCSRG